MLIDSAGNVLAQREWRRGGNLRATTDLQITTGGAAATLNVTIKRLAFTEYELLVLRHAQTALGFELSRGAVSAAELRLAGDLVDDLEHERLDDTESARRLAAFGLDVFGDLFPLLVAPSRRDRFRMCARLSPMLDLRGIKHLSAIRAPVATSVQPHTEDEVIALVHEIAQLHPTSRVSTGRGVQRRLLGQSLLEAQAAFQVGKQQIVSHRDLGSLELLLNLPPAMLDSFIERNARACSGQAPAARFAHGRSDKRRTLERRGPNAWSAPPYLALSHRAGSRAARSATRLNHLASSKFGSRSSLDARSPIRFTAGGGDNLEPGPSVLSRSEGLEPDRSSVSTF